MGVMFIKEGFGLSLDGLDGFGLLQKRQGSILDSRDSKVSLEVEMLCKCYGMI